MRAWTAGEHLRQLLDKDAKKKPDDPENPALEPDESAALLTIAASHTALVSETPAMDRLERAHGPARSGPRNMAVGRAVMAALVEFENVTPGARDVLETAHAISGEDAGAEKERNQAVALDTAENAANVSMLAAFRQIPEEFLKKFSGKLGEKTAEGVAKAAKWSFFVFVAERLEVFRAMADAMSSPAYWHRVLDVIEQAAKLGG